MFVFMRDREREGREGKGEERERCSIANDRDSLLNAVGLHWDQFCGRQPKHLTLLMAFFQQIS